MNVRDWERMSWHARQKYMRRARPRVVVVEPAPVPDPVHVRETVQRPKPAPFRNDNIVTRCNQCGAWIIDVCHTNHGGWYES